MRICPGTRDHYSKLLVSLLNGECTCIYSSRWFPHKSFISTTNSQVIIPPSIYICRDYRWAPKCSQETVVEQPNSWHWDNQPLNMLYLYSHWEKNVECYLIKKNKKKTIVISGAARFCWSPGTIQDKLACSWYTQKRGNQQVSSSWELIRIATIFVSCNTPVAHDLLVRLINLRCCYCC